ncbi:MAG: hypothetical protein E6R03_08935 [Hyphomicrobiaceae bacterium]|nr:MAG: hypothetical protein E6R03_08935 [Hyphomicrobiaceae bacterium]
MSDPYPQYQLRTEKTVVDGYAPLNNIGVVPAEHLPTDLVTDSDIAAHEAAADPHTGYQKESEKGAANGYPSLDSTGKIPAGQLPDGMWGWNSFASGFLATTTTAIFTVPAGKAARIGFLSVKNVTSTTQTVDVLIHRSGESAVSVGTVELAELEYAWYVSIGEEEWNLSEGDAIEAVTSNSSSAAFVLLGSLIDG